MRAYATELMHPAVAFALPQNSTERKGNAAKASKARERGKKITVQVGTVSGFFLCGAGEPRIRVVFNGKIQAFRYAKKRRKAMANGDITTPKKNMVETKQIALLFGLTVRRIQQLTQDGILQTEMVGRQRKYDLLGSVRRYIEYLQKRVSEKGTGNGTQEDADNESRKLRADADFKQAKAEMAQLELDEIQGKLHRSEDVEAMTNDLVFNVRSMMLALPGRLAIDLAAITEPTEISNRVKREVDAILIDLSNYKYNPEAYKKRVRDRQGKDFEESTEEGDE